MRRHLINALILIGIASAQAFAMPVSREEAFLSARTFLDHIGHNVSLDIEPSTRSAENGQSTPSYYIFNANDNAGFVIISADDCARTVLGYSLSGNIDPDNLPTPCAAWLAQYSAEISSLSEASGSERGIETRAEESGSSELAALPMEPLLKSLWNQEAPYNLDCPKDAEGRPYVTGCVATAVAQIMYYYRYPQRATGSVSYEDKATATIRTLNFSDYPDFAWDKMTDTYNIQSSSSSCQAVASLMKAVGFASQMQYGTTSIAVNTNAAKALIYNFGYDKNIHKYDRSLMSDSEWATLILDELYDGRPVLYDGYNAEGGHTFVCDGYDGNGFFHINWGWGGLSDGYYSLSALNPTHQSTGGTSSGYNLHQMIITHIAPPDKYPSEQQTDYQIDISSMHFHSETGFTLAGDDTTVSSTPDEAYIFIYAYNKGFAELSGEVCMAIMDGNVFTPIFNQTLYFLQPNSRASLRFYPLYATLPDGSTLPKGSYSMGFFYRPEGEEKWSPMRSSKGVLNECEVTIGSDLITMSTAGIAEDSAVEVIESNAISMAVAPGLIRVSSPVKMAVISLYDMNGRMCTRCDEAGYEQTISTAHLSPGIYILHLITTEGRSSAVKVKL